MAACQCDNSNMPLMLRPTFPQDEKFVYDLVYELTAERLLAHLWDPNIRHQILDFQVRAQHSAWAVSHPNAEHAIIMLDDAAVGRMVIDRSGPFYDLVDIAIAPKHRGAGIGTRLILALCMEAGMSQKSVRLYVNVMNPRAIELYKR